MKKIEVNIMFDGINKEKVGSLSLLENDIYFKYDKGFIKKKLNLSPFKLKLDESIQKCPSNPFDKLFGLFNDSLPDGWGKLIVDRYLIEQNKNPDNYTQLSRLSIVGKNGLGALTYHPTEEVTKSQNLSIGLTAYAEQAIQLLSGKNAKISDEFYSLTGTSGGARPKIQVIYNKENEALRTGHACENENEAFWLIKFPSTYDLPDIAQIEYAYYLMAKDAGIEIADSKLFEGKKGKRFFGTQRFDRIGNNRIHLHSVAGLLHDDFRKSTLDYGHIIDASIRLNKNKKSVDKIMRLAIFNVLTANQDDHSKNFSFIMNANGEWEFSPAYDLTFSPNSYGFQTTSVASKNKNISYTDFESLSNHFDLQNTLKIWNQVRDVIQEWNYYAKRAGVTEISQKRIANHILS